MVFVSQNYLEKVGGVNGPQDQCKKEFEYAERTKGADTLIQPAGPTLTLTLTLTLPLPLTLTLPLTLPLPLLLPLTVSRCGQAHLGGDGALSAQE